MANKTQNEKLLDYLFQYSCVELESMRIVKETDQTDNYKIVIQEKTIDKNLTKDDINYICELIDPKHERVCNRDNIQKLCEFTNKTLLILQAFLKHFR